jgi:hypothetical protein
VVLIGKTNDHSVFRPFVTEGFHRDLLKIADEVLFCSVLRSELLKNGVTLGVKCGSGAVQEVGLSQLEGAMN